MDHVAIVAAIGVERQLVVGDKPPAFGIGRHRAKVNARRLRLRAQRVECTECLQTPNTLRSEGAERCNAINRPFAAASGSAVPAPS